MLFTNSSTGADSVNSGKTDNIYYWFGSPFVFTETGIVALGLRSVNEGYVISGSNLYNSNDTVSTYYYGVRPVVTIDSKVQLKDSNTQKDGCKLYNIAVE